MRKISFGYYKIIAGIFLALLFSGCLSIPDSPNPRFYTLSAIDESKVTQKFSLPADTIIGLGPVKIPEYLNRPQIVAINKNKTLSFAQFDRWGEPLDPGLTRLIRQDLMLMLPGATLVTYPWRSAVPVKYQVTVDLVQLESELVKDLFFVCQWSIIDVGNNKMMIIKRSEFRQPIDPHTYSGLTEALSAACASLSNEIAQELSTLETTQPQVKTEAAEAKR
ncbi:MAG: PqiC family protein [Candidatus Omnitrophica bacterium]|nr:PqiC family protein [Candidatus Omnitrophota bacterium]